MVHVRHSCLRRAGASASRVCQSRDSFRKTQCAVAGSIRDSGALAGATILASFAACLRGWLSASAVQISHEDAQSSRDSATTLETANRRFIAWLRRMGVPLLPHRLSFYDLLPMKTRTRRTAKNPNLNVGAFGRIDIGIIAQAMREELVARGLDAERVFYTDTDVLFAGDIDYTELVTIGLPTFAAGTEVFSPALNSGVMLINVSAWAVHHSAMVEYGQRRNFRFLSYDQTWVQEYFSKAALRAGLSRGWAALDDAAYNARGYLHPVRPPARRDPVVPKLWHWHGFKPHDVECWHRAIQSGAWPLRAWRNAVPGCTGKTRPRCLFMPVHNSGCRYFGRLTAVLAMTPCYLRTYTHLLMQHRRMLDIAHKLDTHDAAASMAAAHLRTSASAAKCDERAAARLDAWDNEWGLVSARARDAANLRAGLLSGPQR